MSNRKPPYHVHRFPPQVISHAVWLYTRFCLSFRWSFRISQPDVENAICGASRAPTTPNAFYPFMLAYRTYFGMVATS